MSPVKPVNRAAWLDGKGLPLKIYESPYKSPAPNEILIKNAAVAINLVDCVIPVLGTDLFPSLKFPHILGSDIAGEVVEVGTDVTRFKKGDRVLAYCNGLGSGSTSSAFQDYSPVLEHLVSHIPSSISYESASVIPLPFVTAAYGLFDEKNCGLQYPSPTIAPTGKYVFIGGGSSSVGSNAIQLAIFAGYKVITTASPMNFDYVKKLGASEVFDYKSETVIEDLIKAFEGKTVAGALGTNRGSPRLCAHVLSKSQGVKHYLSCVGPIEPEDSVEGVTGEFYVASPFPDSDIGKYAFKFLEEVLEKGKYVASPEPEVIGKGLESFQFALETLRERMDSRITNGAPCKKVTTKLVVTL
ncbi:hypothetical protein PACTADRAFT_43102 [Pachysolen tannophilus NRRL Y-2460]|uniref:Enoyl reductase (ER) domain-containing protein n=1 Tax=Pachysolen tannophilus NRRL Y-2460 TaxID=669874 RepID=A0A1E4TU67_PACTA|nr:hypothetical protein PACTADRAFT_43102 [Pachysolen tannophilus NRRL Y-2460]